jgi:hypothetical protein
MALVILAGCASAPASGGNDLPEWYLNPKSVYPDNQYLTAVGTGDSRRDAEQQALAGLSQTFEAEVSVDARTRERYEELMTAEGTASESEVQLVQSTRVASAQTLLNVQFGEAAVDEEGRVHVIAYLERAPTAQVYRGLIGKNSEQVQSYLSEAQASDDPVVRYAYFNAAGVVARSNEVLVDQLRIISPATAAVAEPPYDMQEVVQQESAATRALSFAVSIDGDTNGRITTLVREALSERQFPVAESNPVLVVDGSFAIRDAESTEDFQSVRWTLALRLNGPDGNGLVTYDEEDRAAGVDRQAATSFAYTDAEEAVRDGFIGSVQSYFNGLVLGN